MVEFPEIPTRFILNGNKIECAKRVGIGKKLLADHIKFLSFQNLPTGHKSYSFSDGTEIKVTVNYNRTFVEIFVPQPVGALIVEKEYKCQCYPCFTFSIITEVVQRDTWPRVYNLLVCAGKKDRSVYIEYTGAHGYDWARYPVGTYVFTSSKCIGSLCGVDPVYECLTDLIHDPVYEGTDTEQLFIVPISNSSGMKRKDG